MMKSSQQAYAYSEIEKLVETYNRLDDETRADLTESSVITQFIEPLLRALGWPIEDPERYAKELHTQAGRPDLTLFPEAGGTIFVEAKRFGVIKELKEARQTVAGIVTPGQLTLPGMAADRTPQEQQAINYAFENNATWAILTNFEKLRLFNARRDWLVLSFEKPMAYLDQFDYLWQLSYESILTGELDRLSNQRHREDVDADYLSFINEYRELLARDAITHPGANRWAFVERTDRVDLPVLRDVVQRFLDRLVVVRFAEDHFVLKPGTLRDLIEANRNSDYGFSLNTVMRQFFRRFDDLHDSALFALDPILDEQAEFSEDLVAGLVDKLYEARYRAMTPDIMGNTYEQYLGTTLVQIDGQVETRANLETRKKQGSYYTPQVIVRYLVDNSLGRYLYGTANGKPDGDPVEGEHPKSPADIQDLRVLDPACGSGSFLIYAYEVLADFYRAEIARLSADKEEYIAQRSAELGNPLEAIGEANAAYDALIEPLKDYPRTILERHLYGVDLDPQAAELAAVNLIFRAMEDQRRMGVKRKLPLILNQNVKCGNALIGTLPRSAEDVADVGHVLGQLHQARAKLAGNSQDEFIQGAIQEWGWKVKPALDEPLAEFFDDVYARRPFHWAVEFPECFVDEEGQWLGDDAGFDVIVGNPPWEIVKPDLREYYAQFDPDIESKLTRKQVEQRIKQLNALDPKIEAGWEAQKQRIEESAAFYKTDAAGFTRQGRGDTATHKLFLEQAYGLLKSRGRLGYVVPSGIYTDLGTKELREMLLNEGDIHYLFSFSNERFFFPGVDHRFKFTLLGARKGTQGDGFWATFRFNPRVAVRPEEMPSFLADADNLVYIRRESLERFSPDSLSVMEFQTQRDYGIVAQIYGARPLMGEKLAESWSVKLNNEFHFTNDRHRLNQQAKGMPFYEGKMIHQFDAFFADPQFWIDENELLDLSEQQRAQLRTFRVVHRRIAATTNERTLISTIVLPNTACEVNATVVLITNSAEESIKPYVCALLNSFVLDYVIRYKVATTLNMFYMYQLPLPRLNPGDPFFDAIVPHAARLTCTTPDFADLWQEVMGEPWDESKGAADPDERQRLRDEIDALVAHLYGLSHEDFEHTLGTFPLVFPDDEEGHAKKEALLNVYDEFAGLVADWRRK
jgi:hypothetical protein